ncbi:EamA/RhaT family transporter [Paracoccus tegillarcae]|uniref:EamA/RhaT family transporter n=2 Tax=Paracoccus tegillarcae TaxID=1529068 RepID=A0A2K9ETV3_9RHOB|nr:EamA/RhaT family transporter [Paracoccus tegillarcae]
MIASLASFISMAVASRELSLAMPIAQILVLRSIVGLGVVLILARHLLPELRQLRDIKLHAARNLVHFSAQYCWTLGVALMPLAEVFALEFTMPIWVAIFAWAALGERIGRARILAIIASFAGVLIVLQPGTGIIDPAALIVLLAAAGYGASAVFVKRLTRHSSSAIIVVWMVLMQLPMGVALMAYQGGWVPVGWPDMPWVLLVGISALSAHYTMAQALRVMDASIAIPIDFLRVPLIAVVGWLLYDEKISTAVFIGAGLIFAANFLAMRSEARSRRKSAALAEAGADAAAGAVMAAKGSARHRTDHEVD